MNTSSLNKISPTRKECEDLIKHILNQEIHQRSTNCHFRHSVDFLPFFDFFISTKCISLLNEELRELGSTYYRAIAGIPENISIEKFAYQLSSQLYAEPVGLYYGEGTLECLPRDFAVKLNLKLYLVELF